MSVHRILTDTELASQASDQLMLELQRAVSSSEPILDMSRQRDGEAKTKISSTATEPASKKRKVRHRSQGDTAVIGDTALNQDAHTRLGKVDLPLRTSSSQPTEKEKILSEQRSEVVLKRSIAGTEAIQDEKKPKLKRFGSEDLPNPLQDDERAEVRLQISMAQNDVEDDSDDDAPEEAVVGVSQDRIGTTVAKAAEAQANTQKVKKARQREHNRRMKEQQAASNKQPHGRPPQQNGSHDSKATDENSPSRDTNQQPQQSSLPNLLPEELLAREASSPVIHAPLPKRSQETKQIKQKLLLDKQERPPKDRFQGDTRIRVLDEQPSSLPPKSHSAGKGVREKWLLGRRGHIEKTWTPRETPSAGFARNPKKKQKV